MSFSEGRDRDPLVSDEIGEEERLKDGPPRWVVYYKRDDPLRWMKSSELVLFPSFCAVFFHFLKKKATSLELEKMAPATLSGLSLSASTRKHVIEVKTIRLYCLVFHNWIGSFLLPFKIIRKKKRIKWAIRYGKCGTIKTRWHFPLSLFFLSSNMSEHKVGNILYTRPHAPKRLNRTSNSTQRFLLALQTVLSAHVCWSASNCAVLCRDILCLCIFVCFFLSFFLSIFFLFFSWLRDGLPTRTRRHCRWHEDMK